MKNYLSALTRCLILLLFIISGNPLQAQSNFDAYVITSAPVNDVVEGTMFMEVLEYQSYGTQIQIQLLIKNIQIIQYLEV